MEFGYSALELSEYIREGLRFPVHHKDYAVTLLGLKGCQVPASGYAVLNENDPDLYNDSLFLLWHEDTKACHETVTCTLEPGHHYTVVLPHPKGAARLPEHRLLEFKWGKHHGRDALVPADLDVVVRDENGNFRIDPHERVDVGNFQVRIHSGGTARSIGRWSAGCIAVWGGETGEPWKALLRLCRKHPFDRFRCVLGRGYDFYRWIILKDANRQEDFRPTLHIGSKDHYEDGNVHRLQNLLNADHGASLEADGDFGAKTLEAFLIAQRHIGVSEPKAVCGPGQWERLEGKLGPYTDEREGA